MTTKTPEPARQAVENPENLKEHLTELLQYHVKKEKSKQ